MRSADNMAINIIIDDSDPTEPVFVEIENDKGESIRIGTDTYNNDNGFRELRITVHDIIKHPKI